MKLALTPSLVVALTMTACGSSNPPVQISHPPLVDLTCPGEPDIVVSLMADPSGLAFDIATRSAGESCRAALKRVCAWHKERGAEVICAKL